jgi:hypothetical protein
MRRGRLDGKSLGEPKENVAISERSDRVFSSPVSLCSLSDRGCLDRYILANRRWRQLENARHRLHQCIPGSRNRLRIRQGGQGDIREHRWAWTGPDSLRQPISVLAGSDTSSRLDTCPDSDWTCPSVGTPVRLSGQRVSPGRQRRHQ